MKYDSRLNKSKMLLLVLWFIVLPFYAYSQDRNDSIMVQHFNEIIRYDSLKAVNDLNELVALPENPIIFKSD